MAAKARTARPMQSGFCNLVLPTHIAPGGDLSLHSATLGLDLRLEDDELRCYDPATGRKLLSYAEAEQARQDAEQRARAEAAARQALEARLTRLESGHPDSQK